MGPLKRFFGLERSVFDAIELGGAIIIFRQDESTGKALDLFATKLGIFTSPVCPQ